MQDEIRSRARAKPPRSSLAAPGRIITRIYSRDIGIETVCAGYEFAHRDDYEGRRVLPTIKVDADSRNIEELHVEADPLRFKPTRTPEQMEALQAGGFSFTDYEGMMRR